MTSNQPTDAELLADFVVTLKSRIAHNSNGTHDDDDATVYMTIRQCKVVLALLSKPEGEATPGQNHAAILLTKLVTAIEQEKPHSALRRIIREGAPILHCNPPFETMSPESKGALVSIVTATQDMFKKPEAPTAGGGSSGGAPSPAGLAATPAQGQITREEILAAIGKGKFSNMINNQDDEDEAIANAIEDALHRLRGGREVATEAELVEVMGQHGCGHYGLQSDVAKALLTTFSITRKPE